MVSDHIHRISNHPVHIVHGNSKELSPSSFIPFCQFGDTALGERNDLFPVPVCNIFRSKIFNDQLCYEVDLNQYKTDYAAQNLKKGFTFFVDNNEDRQYSWVVTDVKKRKSQGK